jgi:hypothetical protein
LIKGNSTYFLGISLYFSISIIILNLDKKNLKSPSPSNNTCSKLSKEKKKKKRTYNVFIHNSLPSTQTVLVCLEE